MITRRNVLLGTTAAISAGLLTRVSDARAAEWPVRPITINIGNAPGGDDDTLSRFLAQTASEELGQPVVIENRAGGSTTVAGNAVAGAKPDGYNILCLIWFRPSSEITSSTASMTLYRLSKSAVTHWRSSSQPRRESRVSTS
nr:tripartite tricarboxylate transporter substrate-binding protein [Rhizobium leguminosarum]